jgi:signal transduction histidine kinase
MRIRLVSRDRHVERLCREGLAKLRGTAWSLHLDPDDRLETAVDLSIVDLDGLGEPYPVATPGEDHGNGHARILLYSQERLRTIQGALPAATIVLKPLQRELFLALLECAIQQCGAGKDSKAQAVEQPEASGSERLLQQVLGASVELQRFHSRQMHFLARGLHDLRAPLTAIEGYSGLLLAERFGPLTAMQRENLRRMQQSVGRLSRMTTDIFDLSLGERGSEEPELQPGDLAQRIQQVLDEMMPSADGKQIHLSSNIAPPPAPLHFDDAQIHSVLTNLLENACRFTPRNGSIEVGGRPVFWERRRPEVREAVERERRAQDLRRPNAYRVDIHDSGPGVPAEHLDSIFEPYTSYSGSQDRAGSGLGLAICRMVINAHGGRIFAEPGEQGAVFSFVLPFAERPAQGRQAQRLRPQVEPVRPGVEWRQDIAEESA